MKKLNGMKKWFLLILVILFAVIFTACSSPSNNTKTSAGNETGTENTEPSAEEAEEPEETEEPEEEKVYDSYIIKYSIGIILLDDVTKEEFDDFKSKITVSPSIINKNPKQIYSIKDNIMTISSGGGLKKFFSLFWPERYGSDQDILIMMVHFQDGTPDKVIKFLSVEEYYLFKDKLRIESPGKDNDYSTWPCSGDDSRYSFWILTDEGYDRLINERWRQSDPLVLNRNYDLLNAAPTYSSLGAEFLYWVDKYGLIEEEDYFVDNKKYQIRITASGRTKLGDLVI